MRWLSSFLGFFLAVSAFGSDGNALTLGQAADGALQKSMLTFPGSKPFHLQAVIGEDGEPDSDYQAKIEEYWVSPTKWRRTITSPDFSQTLVVNGFTVSEINTGDYFPVWLNDFVTAIFDPLPMLDALRQSHSVVPQPKGSKQSTSCADLHARVDRWVICFEGTHGLLTSVFTKGYSAEFKAFKRFEDKYVARQISTDPEPGTKLVAQITELTVLAQPYEQIFVVQESTPLNERIKRVRIDEETLRSLVVGSTDIIWPQVGDGLTTGGCAVYVSADRKGNVREAWPEGCDSASLQEPLRQQVKQWHLAPFSSDGVPVQVEALLGFTFHVSVDESRALPELLDHQVRALVTNAVEPVFPPGSLQRGNEVIVQISVDETGKLAGIQNTHSFPDPVFFAAYAALRKWHFTPYIKNGKPQYFHANVIFRAQ